MMRKLASAFAGLALFAVLTAGISIPANAAPARVVTTAAAPVEAFVTALYADFLNRTPATTEISYWATQLSQGAPRGAIANSFANSDEYRLIRIINAYHSILGREPDSGGELSWLTAMQQGRVTPDDIEKSFYASAEFMVQNGGNLAGAINGYYEFMLGRAASWDDSSYWIIASDNYVFAHLDWRNTPNGTHYEADPVWIINQIFNSVEAARARVSTMYGHYLGRQPDEGGLAGWAIFDLNYGDATVRADFTASDEYYQRALQRFPS